MKVVGYVRVSTEEQAINGVSLDAQEEKIRAYCQAKGWRLTEGIRDQGISAKNLNRDGLQSVLKQIPKRNGKRGFDALIVTKLDRLTRSVGDLAHLNRLFDLNKLSFVSIQESVDASTASGRLFHNIVVVLSEWERGVISERTQEALQHKRRHGKLAGELPYGFRLGKDRETLIPIEQEQATLRKIKKLMDSGVSFRKIADRLNQLGVPTKKGKLWFGASVKSVLDHSMPSFPNH